MDIYLYNLNYATTTQQVDELFSLYGQVTDIRLPKKPGADLASGIRFVTMPSTREARCAIAGLDGCDIDGRSIDLREAWRRR